MKNIVYGIDIKRVMRSKLVLGIADGWLSADGRADLSRARSQGRPVPRRRPTGKPVSASPESNKPRTGSWSGAGRSKMKRVVVTGMGIVSSIGNNTQEVVASLREAKSGIVRADKYAELGFRCQVHGAPTLDRERGRSTAAPCAFSAAAPPGTMSPWSRRSATPALTKTTSRTSAPASSWVRAAPRRRAIVETADITRSKGPKRVGPFAVPKAMSSTASATLADLVQDQGRQLFDLVGLRDLEPLHRQCLRDHSGRQAGHDFRRRLRGARLDAVGAVRRHGRDVVELQSTRRTRPRALTTPIATAL